MALLYRYLDSVGDGSGTTNFNGDYSSTQGIARIDPAAGQEFNLARMIVSMEDTAGMQAQEYGNLGGALTNGISIGVSDAAGLIVDLTAGIPVKTNAKWGSLCYDVDVKSWGSGNELLLVRWTFSKTGDPLIISGNNGMYFWISMDDDLRGLLEHRFMIQGTY